MEQKILKIKVGEVFINNENVSVFQTAWRRESKDKKTTYYEVRYPIFVQTVQSKDEPKADI